MTAVFHFFHLNNREAKRELKVYNSNGLLRFCNPLSWGKTGQIAHVPSPFSDHVPVALRKKLSLRVTLLRRLVASGWGCWCQNFAQQLSTAALSLVYSTAEYCTPVWFLTLSMAYRGSLDCDNILYDLLSGSDARQERLRSRCPFVLTA